MRQLHRLTSSSIVLTALLALGARAQRQMEHLDRGLVAVPREDASVFLSWRLLGDEPRELAFDVYRASGDEAARKINDAPLRAGTCFVDQGADASLAHEYRVHAASEGACIAVSRPARVAKGAPQRSYISIPMRSLEGYAPNDASVGDLDGDGQYEIVVHQVGRGRDNSRPGVTTQPVLEAYELDGTPMWRIELGRNIREGAHYTQFLVYDFDGDGCAEIVCKTADGTVDGKGQVLGDELADFVDSRGFVLDGPEFLTVFDGRTGAALATTDYIPPRGNHSHWGDPRGNRVDRFLACVAYLDGERPSIVMCRGYYTRVVLAAWNWRGGELSHVWTFDSDKGPAGNREYRGQGNHSVFVADVDADGRDEILYGACTIDHNGEGLYTTRLGHGDAQHVSDLDPTRPGLEVFSIQERPRHKHGINLRDARTGEILWSYPSRDVGRGLAIDIDPRHPGHECWASGPGLGALYNVNGKAIGQSKPRTCNMAIWWDGDLLREMLDGVTISKWDYDAERTRTLFDAGAEGCAPNNGTKSNPCLSADILGDWREEVIWRTADNSELRVYTTTIETEHRFATLMHGPVYRLAIAWQNVGYNQPPHTSFFLGHGMKAAPETKIRVVRSR